MEDTTDKLPFTHNVLHIWTDLWQLTLLNSEISSVLLYVPEKNMFCIRSLMASLGVDSTMDWVQ